MIKIATMIAEAVFRGPTAKARAGAATGVLISAFESGLLQGAGGSVEELGFAIGQVVIGGAVGYILTWLPANKAKQ
jgi:hypothetical protein